MDLHIFQSEGDIIVSLTDKLFAESFRSFQVHFYIVLKLSQNQWLPERYKINLSTHSLLWKMVRTHKVQMITS